jgi:hypothetical protein
MESWEQPLANGPGAADIQHRKMSFNPISELAPPPTTKADEPVTPIEVPKAKRIRKYTIRF